MPAKPTTSVNQRRRFLLPWLCAAAAPVWAQEPTLAQRAAQLARLQDHVTQLRALDLIAMLASSPGYAVFVGLVHDSLLAQTLSAPGPFTFFVPADVAWAGYSDFKQLDHASPEEKASVVLRHVCMGDHTASDMAFKTHQSLARTPIRVGADAQEVNGAGFVAQNIAVRNGRLHIVRSVIA